MISVAGSSLKIVAPRRLALRPMEELTLEAELSVADPWIEKPRYGREVRDIDGSGLPGMALAFESDAGARIAAPFSGHSQVQDTRIDVHTPRGFPEAGAGAGHEVVITNGVLECRIGHLARGSGKSGNVRAGDAVGSPGNTGRVVDGCGKHVLVMRFAGFKSSTLDDLFQPIDVELVVQGKAHPRVRFPAGETSARLTLGRVRHPRERGSGSLDIMVRALRRGSVVATMPSSIELVI